MVHVWHAGEGHRHLFRFSHPVLAKTGRLALTAGNSKLRADAVADSSRSGSETVIESVARLCKSAIGGRRAARVLSEWARRFALSEAEFHVLWRLRDASHDGLDQTTIAEELAFSAAQVSVTVERLRARDLIFQQPATGDRRRHLWRLSAGGGELISQMLNDAAQLQCEPLGGQQCAESPGAREAAA